MQLTESVLLWAIFWARQLLCDAAEEDSKGRRLTFSTVLARPGVVACALVSCVHAESSTAGGSSGMSRRIDLAARGSPSDSNPTELCVLAPHGAAVVQAKVPHQCIMPPRGDCAAGVAAREKLAEGGTAQQVVAHIVDTVSSRDQSEGWVQYGAATADGEPGASYTGHLVDECYDGQFGPYRDGCVVDAESGTMHGWSYSMQGNVLTESPQGGNRRRVSQHATVVDFGEAALATSGATAGSGDLTCTAGKQLIAMMLHGPENGGHGDTRCTSDTHTVAGHVAFLRIAEVHSGELIPTVELFVGTNELQHGEGAEDLLKLKWEYGMNLSHWCAGSATTKGTATVATTSMDAPVRESSTFNVSSASTSALHFLVVAAVICAHGKLSYTAYVTIQ